MGTRKVGHVAPTMDMGKEREMDEQRRLLVALARAVINLTANAGMDASMRRVQVALDQYLLEADMLANKGPRVTEYYCITCGRYVLTPKDAWPELGCGHRADYRTKDQAFRARAWQNRKELT